MLLRSKFFWVATVLFLGASLALIWKAYPPLLKQMQEKKSAESDLVEKVTQAKDYSDQVKSLSSHRQEVADLNQKAVAALPTDLQPELLLLQLNAMLGSLNLGGATVTVPFGQATSPVVSTPAPAAAPDSSSPKAGSVGNSSSAPVVKQADNSQATFTISGTMSFDDVQRLLEKLRSFGRWNKVTALDINQNADGLTVNLTGQVFFKASTSSSYTGSEKNFLDSAKKTFGSLNSYATVPSTTQEGQYGRGNPFAAIK